MPDANSTASNLIDFMFEPLWLRTEISQSYTELFLELRDNLVTRHNMILSAAAGDLDGAHDGGKAPGGLPVKTLRNAVQQTGAVCIAAAGGIDYLICFNARISKRLPPA